jgi:hypothetical protein
MDFKIQEVREERELLESVMGLQESFLGKNGIDTISRGGNN